MPDPNQDNQSVNSQFPPVITPTDDLPTLPPDFQNVASDNPSVPPTSQTVDPATGSAAPPETITPDSSSTITATSATPKKKFGGGRIIATILGVLLLVVGVGTGVYLVKQQQDLREKAWVPEGLEGGSYIGDSGGSSGYYNPSTGKVVDEEEDEDNKGIRVTLPSPDPGTIPQPAKVVGGLVYIGDCLVDAGTGSTTFKVGNNTYIYGYCPKCVSNRVTINNDVVSCGPGYYPGANSASTGIACYPVEVACETGCETTTVDEKTVPVVVVNPPTPPPSISASCTNIKAYDKDWNLLSNTQLSQLAVGDKVRFVVLGSATSGTFDKGKFTINGVPRPEVTAVRPGTTNEFYDEYTIPAGVPSFTVTAKIHHSTAGWI